MKKSLVIKNLESSLKYMGKALETYKKNNPDDDFNCDSCNSMNVSINWALSYLTDALDELRK